MSTKKNTAAHDHDAELDALVAQCEQCKVDLSAPPVAAAEGDAVQPKAVDPATVLAILDVVLKLIAAWRARK